MEFRGGPPNMRARGPPNMPFRPRGGGGNNHINRPIHNQHPHPPQVPTRLFAPAMNQAQWNPPNQINNYNPQEEGVNFNQPPYPSETGYSNYQFHPHPNLPSPEVMNATPQPQGFTPYPPPQQMFIQPPMFMEQVCYQQPPLVTSPPMVQAADTNPQKKFHYNNKDIVAHCSSCGHKNILAETEIIKRDEKIEELEKTYHTLKKLNEKLMAENAALLLKIETHQSPGSTEAQNSVNVEVPENTMKAVTDSGISFIDAKKQSQLSPDAAEFSPKTSAESLAGMPAPASAEVPIVSAKGVMDDDGEASTQVQVNEIGTQVEENLLEKTSLVTEAVEVPADVPAAPKPTEIQNEGSTQAQHENWSDEVDKTTTQEDSSQGSKMEQGYTATKSPPVANDEWDESSPVTSSAAPEDNWRENSSRINSPTPDHWQQKGHQHRERRQGRGGNTKYRGQAGQAPGYVRGRRNDQEVNTDNYRQNHTFNRNERGGYNHQNSFPRFQKPNEENWDNSQRDQRDVYPRQEGGWGNRNYHKQSDEQENRSRERANRSRDNKDGSRRTSWVNRENSDSKEMRESVPQGSGAWRGKDNNFNFNKDEKKETSLPRSSQHQYQGKNNYQNITKVEIPDIVKEFSADLFSSPGDFSLAHCVAQDFRMGSGIAVKFKNEFKRVGELLDQEVGVGGCAHLKDNDRYVFYLVTKEVSTGKPKLEDLRDSLKVMKEKCLKFGLKKLAMPRIGCGLDKLDWSRVKASINEIFQDTDMEIRVYEWNVEKAPESEGNKPERGTTLQLRYREMRLVDIQQDTALLFLGTEDGYMDATAVSLNAKHHFEQDYKKAEKVVGSVWNYRNNRNYDWVYSLIVAKTQKDKVLFTNVEICCSKLSQMLRKDKFTYVGIEYPQGWSTDKTFFEKIVNLFRTSLPKFMELWVCFPEPEFDILKLVRERDGRDRDSVAVK